jgi:hypothetical protein
LESLIDFLVRRMCKQSLKLLWKEITYIHLCETEYGRPTDLYLWRTLEGRLRKRFVNRPQRWAKLVEQANERSDERLPETLRTCPEFVLMFALVYPHRFGRGLLRLMESAAAAESLAAGPTRHRRRGTTRA